VKTLTSGLVVLAGAAALLATTGMAGCEVSFSNSESRETRAYDVPGSFTALKVDGDHGRVEVVGTDSGTVRVEERRSWTNAKNKPRTERTTENGMLSLKTRCAHQVIGFGDRGCEVSYRIEVPEATMADVHSDSGSLSVSGLTGDTLRLEADSGSISAEQVRTKRLSVHADSGKVRISGQADSAELSADSGLIDVDGLRSDRVKVRASSGLVKLNLLKAPSSLDVNNDSGAIKVWLPQEQAYAIDLSSDSGSQRVSPSLRRDSASPHRVKLNSDAGSITVRTLGERDGRPLVPERPDTPEQPDAPDAPDGS
jgi:hypothetical protein